MEGERVKTLALRDNLRGQGLILTSMALAALGVVMVFSTVSARPSGAEWYYRRDVRQLLFAVGAFLLLLILWRIDYRCLARRPWPETRILRWVPPLGVLLLMVGLASAGLVLVLGHHVGGRARWLRYGPVGFQPSEILKFAVLIVLAAFLSRPGARPRDFKRSFLPAIALVGLACTLVVTQDFGTAVIIGTTSTVLLLIGGVPWYYFLLLVPPVAGGFYGLVYQDPQRWGRIVAFTGPMTSTHPAAYQPRQAVISIASGATPAGLGAGVAKHGYLPEDSTDFIFSILCEELGAMGMALVIGLLLIWLWTARRAVVDSADRFGGLLAAGLSFLIGLQAAMHIAVNVKWLPPTGISLPFVSAGGTCLLATAAATAMIVSVSARRRDGPQLRSAESASQREGLGHSQDKPSWLDPEP